MLEGLDDEDVAAAAAGDDDDVLVTFMWKTSNQTFGSEAIDFWLYMYSDKLQMYQWMTDKLFDNTAFLL